MTELRFDEQVAIVTGAGGRPSLGRSYALLLAARGAKIVVNDILADADTGAGSVVARAELVAQEIVDLGGEAISDLNSVANEEDATTVVQSALDAWGRVDILINNAGVIATAPFDTITSNDIRRMTDVHLLGSIWMCRAVWPHMWKAKYGRIVNTTSSSMWGYATLVVYGAVKAGVFSLSRGLAVEGAPANIKVNSLGPSAGTEAVTRMIEPSEWLDERMATRTPEQVAPIAAFLAHSGCPVSGKYFEAAAGRVSEVFLGETRGYTNTALTIEDVRDNWARILDREDFRVIPDMYAPLAEQPFTTKPYERT
jgi:NAD(P)-dependent dehydrogenase (short-subunit alcohol dehydrogenase family)